MENCKKVPVDSSQVSITAYRTLLVLKSLIERSLSLDEIVNILKNDSVTDKSVSKDTARLTINTLKISGCEISRPAKKNGFKYELKYSPFWLSFTKDEVLFLIRLRENLEGRVHWKDIITVNRLFDKIISLTNNKEQIELVNDTKSLGDIRPEVISGFFNNNVIYRKILIEYTSPQFKLEDLHIIPFRVIYENKKLYVLCFCLKYQTNCFLELSRINRIKSINLKVKYNLVSDYDVMYRLTGHSIETYTKAENEQILQETSSYIDVKATVNNEFTFMQRLLSFGSDFKILHPEFFKIKMVNKIRTIQRGYTE